MKTEVLTWRLTPDMKADLEREARREGLTLAALLERLAEAWLEGRGDRSQEEAEQARLRGNALACLGSIGGGDPDRSRDAAAQVKERLRSRAR